MHQTTYKIDKKIVVWFFSQNANTPNLPGGTRHYDFSRELNKAGFECKIFTSNFHSFERKRTRRVRGKFETANISGVHFIFLNSIKYKTNGILRIINMFYFALIAYKAAINRHFAKPDVIVGSSPHLLTAYSAYLVSKFYRVPFIMEVRDIWPLTLTNLGHSEHHPFIIFLSIIEKFLYRKACKIIMLMENGKQYLSEIGVDEKKFVWISNGVDLSWKTKKKNIKTGFDSNKINITYAGTIGEANDIETVIEAANIVIRTHPQIVIHLVGDGVKKESLEREAERLTLSNVKFYNPIAKKNIFSFLSQSDVLLFTLKKADVFRYGNPPNKIFDYLASAKPIIFSSNASNNLIGQAGCGVTVIPSNPSKLAQAIISICSESEKQRRILGNNGYSFVKEYYQIKQLAKDYADCLTQEVLR